MHRRVDELTPHPKNFEIYGQESVTDDLLASIKKKGVMVPLTITSENVIISGHRRFEAAKLAGLDIVPVGIATFESEIDELEAIIEFNRQREKTFVQKMKEAEALEGIEKQRAKDRQGERTDIVEIFPQSESGKTRDKVAQQTGIGSGKTYEVAKKIWNKAKEGDVVAQDIVSKIESGELTIHGGQKILDGKNVHVSNNSGENDWYTPYHIVEMARLAMGQIDTDPASSELANKTVMANVFFDENQNGLLQKWAGSVWLNPPYSQPQIVDFISMAIEKYKKQEISQCCVLVNNATETKWFQEILKACDAVCFLSQRIKFMDKTGNPAGAPLQGQAVLYLGSNIDNFKNSFEKSGVVLIHA